MVEFTEDYEISGPQGTKRGKAFVDTGASFTVLPKPVADELGITPYRPEVVDTNNGPVNWGVGRAEISVGGKPPREQDVFIAPAQNPLAIGAETLAAAGFRLSANMARAARARLATCQGCPERIRHPYLGDLCGLCKCSTPLGERVLTGDCPIGRW